MAEGGNYTSFPASAQGSASKSNLVLREPLVEQANPNAPPIYGNLKDGSRVGIQGDSKKKRKRPLPGTWNDGIFCFLRNLYPSCFCVLCGFHGCWLTGQMVEKTKFGQGKWVWFMYSFILFVLTILGLAGVLRADIIWIPAIFIWLVGIPLRMHVVHSEKINDCYPSDHQTNYWGEVAAAVFLGPCSLCQLARHIYGYDEFDPLDGDAKLDRPDGWEELSEHPRSSLMDNAV